MRKKENVIQLGQRKPGFRTVELSRAHRLAVTSTISLLEQYANETHELMKQANELHNRIKNRQENEILMEGELSALWIDVVSEHQLPAGADPRKLEWLPGGKFRIECPPEEEEGEQGPAGTGGEGETHDDSNGAAAGDPPASGETS